MKKYCCQNKVSQPILGQFSISLPWKLHKMRDFRTFSGGLEMENWAKMGQSILGEITPLFENWFCCCIKHEVFH